MTLRTITYDDATHALVPREIHEHDTEYRRDFETYISIHNGLQWVNIPIDELSAAQSSGEEVDV